MRKKRDVDVGCPDLRFEHTNTQLVPVICWLPRPLMENKFSRAPNLDRMLSLLLGRSLGKEIMTDYACYLLTFLCCASSFFFIVSAWFVLVFRSLISFGRKGKVEVCRHSTDVHHSPYARRRWRRLTHSKWSRIHKTLMPPSSALGYTRPLYDCQTAKDEKWKHSGEKFLRRSKEGEVWAHGGRVRQQIEP